MTGFFLRRDALMRVFGDVRDVRQFELLQDTVAASDEKATAGLAETQALKDATFITLSANAELTGERVLVLGAGLAFDTTVPGQVTVTPDTSTTGGHRVTFSLTGESILGLPPAGFVATREWVNAKEWATLQFTPTTTPASPTAGLTYYDSGTNKLRTYDGTAWQDHW